jgi:hypothetical protein
LGSTLDEGKVHVAGPTGLPSQEVGLSDMNFPFIESGTQAAPRGYGVVKVKNVCSPM